MHVRCQTAPVRVPCPNVYDERRSDRDDSTEKAGSRRTEVGTQGREHRRAGGRMRRRLRKPRMCGVVILGVAAGPASAAGWADAPVCRAGHDFGPVAAGGEGPASLRSDQPAQRADHDRQRPRLVRLHQRPGERLDRPPGQTATVEAEMDTRNFVGHKATALFVTLMTAGGREAEVRLGVSSTILSDVVLNPGRSTSARSPGVRPRRRP